MGKPTSLMVYNYFSSIVFIIVMVFGYAPIVYALQGGSSSSKTSHFNSKQQEEVSGGACVIQTDAFPVGFNAYVVPEGNHPSYPPFCSPVPAGPLNIVIDILAQDMREVPITLKLLKLEDGREIEVSSLPKDVYPFGSIAFAVNLEPLASYKILLLFDNNSSELMANSAEIPFEVRKKGDFVHTGTGETSWGFFFFTLVILGLAGGVIHYFLRSQPR